jgi:hypothetical protein
VHRRPACERTATRARAFAFALTAAIVAGCLFGCTLGGCIATAKAPSNASGISVPAASQPTAILRFGRRWAPGTHGTIAGYIRGWPFADQEPDGEAPAPRFTYIIDFVIGDRGNRGQPTKASGIRKVYFHPEGVRIAFGDDSRLVNGDPVAVEQVNFTLEFDPDFGYLTVRMRGHEISSRSFDYDGRSITPAALRDDSSRMVGRFSAVYGGFLMTPTGV